MTALVKMAFFVAFFSLPEAVYKRKFCCAEVAPVNHSYFYS